MKKFLVIFMATISTWAFANKVCNVHCQDGYELVQISNTQFTCDSIPQYFDPICNNPKVGTFDYTIDHQGTQDVCIKQGPGQGTPREPRCVKGGTYEARPGKDRCLGKKLNRKPRC